MPCPHLLITQRRSYQCKRISAKRQCAAHCQAWFQPAPYLQSEFLAQYLVRAARSQRQKEYLPD